MKRVTRFFHGVLDYVIGLFLLMMPNLIEFGDLPEGASWVPRVFGIVILLQAFATDYELGVMKAIPTEMHLMSDCFVGLFLAVSPWIFGVVSQVAMVALALSGMLVLVLPAMTEPQSAPRDVGITQMRKWFCNSSGT